MLEDPLYFWILSNRFKGFGSATSIDLRKRGGRDGLRNNRVLVPRLRRAQRLPPVHVQWV
jgi:hypothetical protein